MSPETLTLDELVFEVRRSDRRRTLEVSVGRQGELRVYAPALTGTDELAAWVGRKLLWVHQKLALKQDMATPAMPPDFATGEVFSYLGRSYRLKLVDRQRRALDFDGDSFLLRREARERAAQHFRAWYRRHGLPWVRDRIELLAPRVGASPRKVVVRDLGYRWGSCSRSGRIAIHWKTLQLPVRLIDYVIVHELAHLAEARHSGEFWARVERALPDWAERREELAGIAGSYLRVGEPRG